MIYTDFPEKKIVDKKVKKDKGSTFLSLREQKAAEKKFGAYAQKEDLAPIAALLDEYSEDLEKVDVISKDNIDKKKKMVYIRL